jgi:hypothetical protein
MTVHRSVAAAFAVALSATIASSAQAGSILEFAQENHPNSLHDLPAPPPKFAGAPETTAPNKPRNVIRTQALWGVRTSPHAPRTKLLKAK